MKLSKRGICFALLALCFSASGISLDGEWKLSFRPQQEAGEWTTIPAKVPGDVYIDLERAGVTPDPMIGTNVFCYLKYEQYEWKYETSFPAIELKRGERAVLKFAAVDTRAEYWLNGEKLGASENMFVPVEFDVTGKLKASNDLVVNIKSPLRDPHDLLSVLGRSRVGGTDVEGIRKAQHSFGWDIMPRLVSSGIIKSVTLEAVPEVRFGDTHWMVTAIDRAKRTADLKVDCQILAPWRYLHKSKLRLTLSRPGKAPTVFEDTVHFYQTRDYLTLKDVDFWWPRDAGEPALYEAKAEFLDADGTVLAEKACRIGIRTIEWQRADYLNEKEPGTFRFLVNGEPIYMHGCDVTPMDALHSRDPQHMQKCLDMLVDLNCNMVRVWGGGVYEEDAYYDFCDANGILVWQDFMMGNVEPEQNDRFAKAIYDEAKYQVVRLRNHPCLAIWCGNNEQDRSVGGSWGRFAPDPEKDRISREVLPRVLRDFDPLTPYIPSSPWWTPDVVAGKAKLSQDHLWGPRQLCYKGPYWCESTVTFVSEMGCHGCPDLETLKRMMTPGCVSPWPDPAHKDKFNIEWNCKATCAYPEQCPHPWYGDGRNAIMSAQTANMFGRTADDVATFVDQSQIYQAMAVKYWVELFRSRKGRTWGVLWWNLRDGWPIISDGVVDYWFGKKRAYEAIKSVQHPQLATAVEDGRLVAVNDRLYPVKGRVKVADVESGKVLYDAAVDLPANVAVELVRRLPLDGKGCLDVRFDFEGQACVNKCLYGEFPFDYGKVKEWLK